MSDTTKIDELLRKIQTAEMRQQQLSLDLKELRKQIQTLQTGAQPSEEKATPVIPVVVADPTPVIKPIPPSPKPVKPKEKTAWEDFIGTNLLNKVGIAILVIGISFGVKYAIDHDMLSPLTRIVLGYLASVILLVVALRLKKNYEAFSAVLLSGGMAALYFITYAAYDFYSLLPQVVTFILMVAFTAFTVFAALHYKQQALAIIGLVGAYAVPLLLSDGSGRVAILFGYVSIINTGILFISFKQDWRGLFRFAFTFTWLIFFAWMINQYEHKHIWLGLVFSLIYFIQFQIAFLVSKFTRNQSLSRGDIILVLLNCFVFYGLGYGLIVDHPNGENFLGLFTAFNALLHFAVCLLLYYRLRAARDAFYFTAGLVLTFLTLAVPVQLDGNWVTLVWAAESLLLFWIGRTKKFQVYELLSYPLAGLATFSLLHDWSELAWIYFDYYYYRVEGISLSPFLNVYFLTGLLVAVSFGVISWIAHKHPPENPGKWLSRIIPLARFALPASFLFVLYTSFYREISFYFNQQIALTSIRTEELNHYNYDWASFGNIWLLIYTFVFLGLVWWSNKKYITSNLLNSIIGGGLVLTVVLSLSIGLWDLQVLQKSYLSNDIYYSHGIWNIGIRYLLYLFIALALFINYSIVKNIAHPGLQKAERIFFHFTIITLLSSELLAILNLSGVEDGSKLALSILWGVYALYLISWGFVKKLSYLRLSGIVLFGFTLFKLFIYDMANMSTISKTIVLMVLGALLLVASFLYNRQKKN